MAIALVLFDMNGVLCRYDKDRRIAHLARLSGLPPAQVEVAIWGSGFEDAGDAGMMDQGRYLRGFGEALGHPLTLAEWSEAQAAALTPDPAMLALAHRLKAKARVAVLTNNNLLLRDEIGRLSPEIAKVFGSDFHVSAEFGARKPEPECYLGCLTALGARPDQTLFIDDSADNVEGARQAGLIAYHFQTQAALDALLAEHLRD
ncbi:MAG TPA: HAD family phosphatase [Acidisoma sp.]|uniref:HAD family hydrolase n=1 Tax=Acidisoma sp. TaxID=1872115 RepID=UPI002B8B54AB|nr:HAD family phosphatase [Acidisoma sp.]HTI00279.1 HAD family phosphatase [Acidisoma sp.]